MTSNTSGSVFPGNIMLFPQSTYRFGALREAIESARRVKRPDRVITIRRGRTGRGRGPGRTKNLSHPSALRASDLKIGRTVIIFSWLLGELGTYRVVSKIFPHGDKMYVRLQEVTTRERSNFDLAGLGVLPGKASYVFTVDHRKQDLLPKDYPISLIENHFRRLNEASQSGDAPATQETSVLPFLSKSHYPWQLG